MKPLHDIFKKRKQTEKIKEESKEKVIVDYREKNSLVASNLIGLGLDIEFRQLKIGDYIIKDIIIERKTIQDFLNSMLNHRLIKQIEELKQYENKLLIIEGTSEQEIYSEDDNYAISDGLQERNRPYDEQVVRSRFRSEFRGKSKKTRGLSSGINANAIRGFLLSILLKHKIPVIFSKSQEDTAKFINILSKKKEKEINLNAKKKTLNKKEQMQFIIEGFPGIGPKTAKKLLEKFRTISNIINASEDELKGVVGKKAEVIINLRRINY